MNICTLNLILHASMLAQCCNRHQSVSNSPKDEHDTIGNNLANKNNYDNFFSITLLYRSIQEYNFCNVHFI